jgi:hypothetical protein
MKLYNRKDFLELPAGTLYCKGVSWSFGGLAVKGDTVAGVDWYCRHLSGIDFDSTEQMLDRYEAMEASGATFPLNAGEVRDGMFDDDAIFLVLEPGDLEELRRVIDTAAGAAA